MVDAMKLRGGRTVHRRHKLCMAGVLLTLASSAAAQVIPPTDQPGRERFRFEEPSAPLSRPSAPLLELPRTATPEAASQIRFVLKSISIEGSKAYSTEQLTPLYADLIGREITGADIYALRDKVATKYGQDGYLAARAAVVPQKVDPKGAAIRLVVVEGYIERVEWPGGAKRYRDLFTPCLQKITAERPVRTATIEKCLLLAGDLPGLTFTSTIKAGESKDGGAVLIVGMTEKPIDVSARIDNGGSHGRGPWQYVTGFTANNWLGLHESLNLTYASAFQSSELKYIAGSWRQILTSDGLAFDLYAGYSTGKPGVTSLRSLEFASRSLTVEGGFSYPLIRSREQNLSVSALGFVENVRSDVLGEDNTDDRLRGIRLRANYDAVDMSLGTLAQTQAIITLSQGIDGLGSTRSGQPRASIANGRVDFTKIDARLSRAQGLGNGFSVFAAAIGQYSGGALLSPEQCSYGGRSIGRAFDPDELSGDRCWAVLGELRYDLPIPDNPLQQTQLYGFVDHGAVYRVHPSTSTPGRQHGATAGIGLRLAWENAINADLAVAKSLEGRDSKDWRYLMTLAARY